MPRRKTDFRGLADAGRLRVLGEALAHPGSTLQELAAGAGVAVNTARDHAATLVREGLIAAVPSPTGGRGRPPDRYWPVEHARDNTAAARRLERAQTRRRVRERAPGSGGAVAGPARAAQHQLDVVYEHLEDAGLGPTLDERKLLIQVTAAQHCALADASPDLACSVHAHILHDLLAQADGPIRLEQLQPRTEGGSCWVRLARVSAPSRATGSASGE